MEGGKYEDDTVLIKSLPEHTWTSLKDNKNWILEEMLIELQHISLKYPMAECFTILD